MKKLILIAAMSVAIQGCSIIALPFKAVGANGDIIAEEKPATENENIKVSAVIVTDENNEA